MWCHALYNKRNMSSITVILTASSVSSKSAWAICFRTCFLSKEHFSLCAPTLKCILKTKGIFHLNRMCNPEIRSFYRQLWKKYISPPLTSQSSPCGALVWEELRSLSWMLTRLQTSRAAFWRREKRPRHTHGHYVRNLGGENNSLNWKQHKEGFFILCCCCRAL